MTDPTLTPLSGVASVPLGIGDGGHGIFTVDAPQPIKRMIKLQD